MKTNPTNRYDIIGDIHGYVDPLKKLLTMLGYEISEGCYRHPARQAIFLGDFIDRGPAIRETLQIVRPMVEKGAALAVMGNHELNALAYHTLDGNGSHLRPHTPKNTSQHAATLAEFCDHPSEFHDHLNWFETLPLFLDLEGLRIVHACWDENAIRALSGSNRFDRSMLERHGVPRDARREAVNTLLKGPEIATPGGVEYGEGRKEMRVKWWLNDDLLTYRDAGLQVPFELPDEPLTIDDRKRVCGYAPDAAPVFFGHYGYVKPAERFAANVACIDLGVTRGGVLCGYRWDGEREIERKKFVCATAESTAARPHP